MKTLEAEVPISASLADFVCNFSTFAPPRLAGEMACASFADTIGVIFAGERESVEPGIVERALDVTGKGARLIPSLRECGPLHAALVNATAAHALDFDDVALDGHPSAILVPTILAMADECVSTGRELVDAYIIGYQVWGVLCECRKTALHNFGWHPTCVFGAVAAAAACSFLARLSKEETQYALGIAASLTSGLMGNFGSMTKPFQVGRAAEAGVLASRLARSGLTSSKLVFDRSPSFFEAFYREPSPPTTAISEHWHIVRTGLNVKRYPVCYCAQRVIDGVLGLASLLPDDAEIGAISVQIGDVQNRILRFNEPHTVPEAKFCLEFCVAVALSRGRLGLAELNMATIESAPIKALMHKVTREIVPSLPGDVFAAADHVSITTQEGLRFSSGPIDHAKGSFEMPLTRTELFDKFLDCLGPAVNTAKAGRLFEICLQLEKAASIGDLVAALGDLR